MHLTAYGASFADPRNFSPLLYLFIVVGKVKCWDKDMISGRG